MSAEPFVSIKQNATDIVSGRVARIVGLLRKNVDNSIIEMDLATQRKIKTLFSGARFSKIRRHLLIRKRKKALILDNLISVLEVTDEIDNSTVGLADVSSKTASELLVKYSLRLCWSKKQQAFDKRHVCTFIEDVDDAQQLQGPRGKPLGVARALVLRSRANVGARWYPILAEILGYASGVLVRAAEGDGRLISGPFPPHFYDRRIALRNN